MSGGPAGRGCNQATIRPAGNWLPLFNNSQTITEAAPTIGGGGRLGSRPVRLVRGYCGGVSSKAQAQHVRLIDALRRSKAADNAWQRAMADDVRVGGAPATRASRRHLDDLWQQRERAREHLSGLRWVDYGVLDGSRRPGLPAPPIA
jgi:hypothetical protein